MMVGIATASDIAYKELSDFARSRYAKRLAATTSADPDAFAYARESGRIVGCFGIYLAHSRSPLLLETYIPNAFERIAGKIVCRHLCAELGTRAVSPENGYKSQDVSLALAAVLLLYAKSQGVRYVGFTSNRTVRTITNALSLELVELGEPDLSGCNEDFGRNWRTFFRTKQSCFGIRLDCLEGCRTAIRALESHGIRIEARLQKAMLV